MQERDYLILNRETFIDCCSQTGDVIIPTTDLTLQLDIDEPWTRPQPFYRYEGGLDIEFLGSTICQYLDADKRSSLLNCFLERYSVSRAEGWRSKGGNSHVLLTLSPGYELSIRDRITLQAMLGSDPIRELLNLRRVDAAMGDHEACILLMPKASHEFKRSAGFV